MPLLAEQINVTLGTAGHIDHGKTALIRSLTGCDTDRLKEEKERGMSIELGFAPCTLGDLQVGIVDVPGHEHFVKTMVAGATGIDGVIFVVAADDGVMPQTREHLEILTLLGIRHGVVALTKIDRVAVEQVELARSEVRELLAGTFLADAPIVPVSNVTGDGLGDLYREIQMMVRAIEPRRTDGVFRLPVERTFSARGYGTVVCGIPVSGMARVGDEVVILPQNLTGRIKAIQVYKRQSRVVRAGQCTAINVPHWDHRIIQRGHTLATPGFFTPQEWCACRLRLLPHEKLYLTSGTRLKFHTGTSEILATAYLFEGGRMHAGDEGLIQVRLETPAVAAPGDRFILRSLSPVRTIGGGLIIDMFSRRLKRNRPRVLDDLREQADAAAGPERLVEHCLRRGEPPAATEAGLSVRAKVPVTRVREILAGLLAANRAVAIGPSLYLHADTAAEAAQHVLAVIGEFHRTSPESPGMTLDRLRQAVPLDKPVLEGLVELLKKEGRLAERNHRLALPEHSEALPDRDRQLLDAIESLYRQRPFNPPEMSEIIAVTGAARPQAENAVRMLRDRERLVPVAGDMLFHREAVDRARELLVETIRRDGKLESVRFKYLLDTTRKYALPLLDYFDRVGLTLRVNNTRYLRQGRAGPAGT